MNKIRIAYITSENISDQNYWSGSSYSIFNCLKKTNLEIIRLSTSQPVLYNLFFFVEIFFRIFGVKYDRSRSLLISKFYAKKIDEFCKGKKIDYIFVHQCSLVSFVKVKIPIIIWTDLTIDLYQKTYFNNFRYFHKKSIINCNFLERLALKKAKKIIYTTKYAKDNAIKKYRINNKKIDLLPFGSNLNFDIKKKELPKILTNRLQSKKLLLKFLSIGVDWERKGMSKTIKIIKTLKNKGLNCELNIVGCEKPKDYILPKFVKIYKYLDKNNPYERKKLINLFKNCHFFILMSKAEAFGLVFNEASSFGLPSIAPDIGGISYLLNNKHAILIKKEEDIENIVNKIFRILKDKTLYRKMSILSYSRYQNKNNWNIISKKLKNTLK